MSNLDANPRSEGRIRVLAVEDDAEAVRGLQIALAPHGFEVVAAGTVREALESIAARRPELVLLDLQLAGGECGRRFLRSTARADDCRPLPVIVTSGTDSPHSIDQCLAMGAKRYLVKPFTPDKLVQAIEQELGLVA